LSVKDDPGDAVSVAAEAEGAGISSHSSAPTSIRRTKNGHSVTSRSIDSRASALDIGTGDDLTTAETTSGTGSARRLRAGVELDEEAEEGVEKSIHTLSATPSSRPRRHRRRISSWESLRSASLVRPVRGVEGVVWRLKGFGLVGVAVSDRCRMRSHKAARRELVGVSGAVDAPDPRWCMGVEGTADLAGEDEEGGVSKNELVGVRREVGVENLSRRLPRDEGV
jgi:hypothetical protein